MCDCSICIAEKEIRLCKNIAKFLQNLPFQLAKFCILDAKFEIFFCKKTRGQLNLLITKHTKLTCRMGKLTAKYIALIHHFNNEACINYFPLINEIIHRLLIDFISHTLISFSFSFTITFTTIILTANVNLFFNFSIFRPI